MEIKQIISRLSDDEWDLYDMQYNLKTHYEAEYNKIQELNVFIATKFCMVEKIGNITQSYNARKYTIANAAMACGYGEYSFNHFYKEPSIDETIEYYEHLQNALTNLEIQWQK